MVTRNEHRTQFTNLVQRWQAAYQRYITVSDYVVGATEPPAAAVVDMTRASRAVAELWRAMIATDEPLPWWCRAAVGSAAEAFEDLAREWERKIPSPTRRDDLSTKDGRWPDGV